MEMKRINADRRDKETEKQIQSDLINLKYGFYRFSQQRILAVITTTPPPPPPPPPFFPTIF